MTTNGEFKGSTKQAILDMNDRLDRIETKLDRQIERNLLVSAFVSSAVSIIVAVIVFFGKK